MFPSNRSLEMFPSNRSLEMFPSNRTLEMFPVVTTDYKCSRVTVA